MEIFLIYLDSQIDMENLLSGLPYENLPNTYVIFICDFDPYGKGKYRYTRECKCKEVPELDMDDRSHTIFLSTKGTNKHEISEDLVNLLEFLGLSLSESEKDFDDAFVKKLQATVREVKKSREMGARYMTFQELLNDERAEGRVDERRQVIMEFLEDMGNVPNELQELIAKETDMNVLKLWNKIAAKAESIEQFMKDIH